MEKYVITLNRQFGSLGRPIAKILSEKLSIDYFDRDIVDFVAQKTGLTVSTISNAEETPIKKWDFMKYPLGNNTLIQNTIFQTQKKIILDLADRSSCIIVGRCADFVLKDFPNHIRIFIYAPKEDRLNNCVNTLKMDIKEARQMIQDVDKAREVYHLKYAGYKQNDPEHVDMMINSSLLGVDGTASMIAKLVQKYLDERL